MTGQARIKAAMAEQWKRKAVGYISLNLPFPPSVNALWKRGAKKAGDGTRRKGMVLTDRYATWRQSAGISINEQRPGRIDGWFDVHLLVEFKPDRLRDADNLLKPVLDCLQAHRIIENDRLAWDVRVSWSTEISGARVILSKREDVSASSGSVARRQAA